MKLNERKIIEYLESHIGCNTNTYLLIKESGAYEEEFEMDFELDMQVRKIAEDNGFCLNSHHHDNEVLGMPWVIDFYIEVSDVEKDIARIAEKNSMMERISMVLDEYGIYNEYKDQWTGFRLSIPWQIKKIYDEACEKINKNQNEETDID